MTRCLMILLIVFFLNSLKVCATAQHPDILIVGNDTVAIFCNPLEQYLNKKHNRKFCDEELNWTSTACYRGYRATWTIENDSLFLLNVQHGCYGDNIEYFDLRKEFNTDGRIFANWFTGSITNPEGDLLQYIHAGYASIYEKERIFYVSKGIIDSVSDKNYIQYDKNKIKPSEDFLSDTIRTIIISNIDASRLKNFQDSLACSICIRFNEKGIIDSVYNDYTYDGINIMEDYICLVAINSLKNLPPLMSVTHDRYRTPTIEIFFSGYCLKYPWDKEYGCKD